MKIKINNLSKKYSDKVAVDNFSLELTEGVYGLLGPNGAGKTTLMRMIVDILEPTNGEILFNGVNKDLLKERYREVLGYLPQDMGYYKNFTAERFLKYIAALKGINKNQAIEKIDELLKIVNLETDRKRKISKFSGGMIRRLGIAQALLNDPKILILDEPTAGLDPNERIKFRNLISHISKNRIVILSTHIVSDIEFIAKEVILIDYGKLIACKNREELLYDLEGKVWEVIITEKDLDRMEQEYKIVNIMRMDDEIKVRIVNDKKLIEGAKAVKPNFEDVYVHYFKRKEEACYGSF
ncbi:ABC-type multidrug transport system, ATPase component [Clostridium cavendishii DSM 21758]|uniref:ABC-type multidrug transport system, ATPase component n=1 Tax=Clostridium cavendishii DSM 21758 TaxID=1121302 RepID=A0A1M6M1J9_9CLOT|nr:ABC transporter ATP-binding protein [Clostridium cavendishii]SHJ77276.1 ABC-type multidrug transport system, ATPase component [Clostridium cavendishii DSM 21758]